MKPHVSVIIPTYKRAAKVVCAVRSVLDQTFQDYEILVIDDGSKDGTLAALAAIDDPRLRVIEQETNQGVSAARNRGVELAQGKWLAFLDDDDLWKTNKLERQLHYMENHFPSYSVSVTDYQITCDTYKGFFRSSAWSNPYESIVMNWGVLPTTLMVKKDAFKKVGNFDTHLPNYEDCEWFLRCLENHKVGFVPDVLAIYSGGHGDERVSGDAALSYLWEKYKDSFGKNNPELRKMFHARVHWIEARAEIFDRGRYDVGAKHLWQGLNIAPLNISKFAGAFIARRVKRYSTNLIKNISAKLGAPTHS